MIPYECPYTNGYSFTGHAQTIRTCILSTSLYVFDLVNFKNWNDFAEHFNRLNYPNNLPSLLFVMPNIQQKPRVHFNSILRLKLSRYEPSFPSPDRGLPSRWAPGSYTVPGGSLYKYSIIKSFINASSPPSPPPLVCRLPLRNCKLYRSFAIPAASAIRPQRLVRHPLRYGSSVRFIRGGTEQFSLISASAV